MKYYYAVFIFLIFSFNQLISQNNSGIAKYNVSYVSSSKTNNDSYDLLINRLEPSFNLIEYELSFDEKESIFKPKKILTSDIDANLNQALIIAGKGIFYVNREDSILLKQREILGDLFLIEANYQTVKWKITKNRKTIAGFDCIQAIGKINNNSTNPKKDVIAWFTPEINSSFGPKTYFGLPGLILNLKEEFLEFTCFSIVFSNQQIVKPKKGLKIKEEELNNIFMKKAKEEFKLKH